MWRALLLRVSHATDDAKKNIITRTTVSPSKNKEKNTFTNNQIGSFDIRLRKPLLE